MIMLLLAGAVSMLVPLTLCCVPSLARFTVFPLLSSLVHRFTVAYLLPCLQVEYSFGSFDVPAGRGNRREGQTLRGFTLSLFQIQVQPEFLKSLALEKKAIAPILLTAVGIKELTLHISTTWRVIVDIKRVAVRGDVLDPNGEVPLMDLKDAVGAKVGEAMVWLYRFTAQKSKDEQIAEAERMTAEQRQFSFKDRVMQLVMAQIDVRVDGLEVALDGSNAALPSGDKTRLTIAAKEVELLSDIIHDDAEKAIELLPTDPNIKVSHSIYIEDFRIDVSKAVDSPERDSDRITLLGLPSMELKLELPPMARVLCLVPYYAPVPLDQRTCRVQLLLPTNSRITIDRDHLVWTLRDVYLRYADYQVAVQTIRMIQVEEAIKNPLTDEEKAFYVESFRRVETDAKLPAAEKATLLEKIASLDERMTLDDVLVQRALGYGLPKHFNVEPSSFEMAACIALANKIGAEPVNVMFSVMAVALRLESFSINFEESKRQIAELNVSEMGLNLDMYPIAKGDDKLLKRLDMTLEQTIFSVSSPISTVGPAESPSSKLLYADFTRVREPLDEAVTRPQQIQLKYAQYETGKQSIDSRMNGLQLVVAARELEYFLLFVDRLNTDVGGVLATARPPVTQSPVTAEGASMPVEVTSPISNNDKPNMAPFSKLGGMLLDLDATMNGCRMALLPSESFAENIFVDADLPVEGKRSAKSQVDIPLDLIVEVRSSMVRESVRLEGNEFAIIARHMNVVSSDDDLEFLLAPAALAFNYSLEVNQSKSSLCEQTIAVKMPDFAFAFSDLSLALVSSCLQALGNMKMTTPEQAQLRLENQQRQEELRKRAEVDAVLDRIRRMFDDIDADGNGHIEMSELLMLLRRVKVADTLLESELEYFVRILFKDIDQDGNGFVEFDELRAYLRGDLLSNDTGSACEVAGSGELQGFLNLRGGEYHALDQVEKLAGTKPSDNAQLEELVTKTHFKGRFWDLYERETRASRQSLNGQHPLDVQKKLVRLLKHYHCAELCWTKIIVPELNSDEAIEWVLQPSIYCGGVSEYQSPAKVIAQQKKDSIFSVALREAEEKLMIDTSSTDKKELRVVSDIKVGNLKFVLTDVELPVQYSRGDFSIQDVTCSFNLSAGDIDASSPVDWVATLTSEFCEWTALVGFRLSAMCFNDIANQMEHVIEPWEMVMAFSSAEKETGVSALLEAEKRFQINVTAGLLKMYRALNDVLAGDPNASSWRQHQEAYRSGLTSRSSRFGSECIVQNNTGCTIRVRLSGSSELLEIKANERVHAKISKAEDGKIHLDCLDVDTWGQSDESYALPSFGAQNIRVKTPGPQTATLFVTAYCRLEDPLRQRIVLKSNLYVCNHTAQDYHIKYLTIGSEERSSVTSEVLTLRPRERLALPASVLMGITEVYARPSINNEWTVKATINNDLLTSVESIQDLDAFEEAKKARQQQKRGAIVFADSQETCSKVVKQLTSSVLIRRWHLRTHCEWEFSLLPPFVVRNSLPYRVEYRFIEYTIKGSKNVNADFVAIETALQSPDGQVPPTVVSGIVGSGQDAEIAEFLRNVRDT
ncbi:hypothetical protein PINS_up022645 [Pythium insidiosum]|nr:hypothetical protein PINS_up022645 [Pythium insidiosum]